MINFHAKKTKSFREKVCCVQPLCELQLFAALDANDTRHHPHLELRSISLFSTSQLFSKGRIKASKEGKTIISRGMWRISDMQIGRLSVLSTPVAGSVTARDM